MAPMINHDPPGFRHANTHTVPLRQPTLPLLLEQRLPNSRPLGIHSHSHHTTQQRFILYRLPKIAEASCGLNVMA
eukprot:44900-Eustigmatos_ZCMA.PRE.1